MPSLLRMPALESLTAITLAPSSQSSRAIMLPTFPKPWMATVAVFRSRPVTLQASRRRNRHPRARGFEAAERTARQRRLASDHSWRGMTRGHAVGVHDPRHGLRVGVHIGRGDVLVGADQRRDLVGIAAGETFQFIPRQVLGIAANAALGAAEGYVHQRALPRHPRRQGRYFVEGDVGVIADSTFARSADVAVLHAVGIEDADDCRRPS